MIFFCLTHPALWQIHSCAVPAAAARLAPLQLGQQLPYSSVLEGCMSELSTVQFRGSISPLLLRRCKRVWKKKTSLPYLGVVEPSYITSLNYYSKTSWFNALEMHLAPHWHKKIFLEGRLIVFYFKLAEATKLGNTEKHRFVTVYFTSYICYKWCFTFVLVLSFSLFPPKSVFFTYWCPKMQCTQALLSLSKAWKSAVVFISCNVADVKGEAWLWVI